MTGPTVNESLTFEGETFGGASKRDLIVRDDPEVLVAAVRRKDADSNWTIRGYDVIGNRLQFKGLSPGAAELASIFIELFDEADLRLDSAYSTMRPVTDGVPVAVAADGRPAVAAWLVVRGWTRDDIAEALDVGRPTVKEYLSRFRRRGTGLPDDVELPSIGNRVETVPEQLRHPEADRR